jgi:tol-pal system protein YbgF
MNRISLAALLSVSFASTAWAQAAPINEGSAFVPPPSPSMVQGNVQEQELSPANPAQLELRLSNMEDELRTMRGKNEELTFQIKKLTDNNEKMQRDMEMRLSDIESGKKPSVDVAAKPAAKLDETSTALTTPALTENKTAAAPAAGGQAATTAGDGVLKTPSNSEDATPRDLYNHAFRLLNQTKYDDASKAFEQFTKKYPKDPLIGNAYYWMGETYYIRRDYVAAADDFRAGFEALPTGPKAADNLLKLAMSLNALNRDKEACVVLGQVVTKFKKESVGVTEKAQTEQKRMGCK